MSREDMAAEASSACL